MKILKDSSIYVLGEIVSKLIPFLLFPYLTRKLGVEGFGELSYYQTVIFLLVIFIGMSQDGAITRYFYRYGKRSLSLVVLAGVLYSSCVSAIFLCISLFVNNQIMIYVVLAAFFQCLLAAQLSIRQCQKQALRYVILQLFSSLLSIFITILLFELFSADTLMRVIAIFLANILGFLVAFYFFTRDRVAFCYPISDYVIALKYILVFGVPLVFHHLSFFIKGQLDRVIIAEHFSYHELGIYAAAAQLAMIFLVILQAINKAIVPYFYENIRNKILTKQLVLKYSYYGLLFVPIPALFALFIPNEVYLFFLGDGFNGVKPFTVLFLLGYGLNIPYLILVNYLFYYAKNKYIAGITFISSLFYLISFYAFMYISLYFLPLSIFISNLLMIIMLIYFIKNRE